MSVWFNLVNWHLPILRIPLQLLSAMMYSITDCVSKSENSCRATPRFTLLPFLLRRER